MRVSVSLYTCVFAMVAGLQVKCKNIFKLVKGKIDYNKNEISNGLVDKED